MGREEKGPQTARKKETHKREEHKRARRDDDDTDAPTPPPGALGKPAARGFSVTDRKSNVNDARR